MKELAQFRQNKWVHTAFFRFEFIVAAVHKYVLLSGVAVKIAVKDHASLLVEVDNKFFRVVDRWMKPLMRSLPTSIEVTPCQGASVVTINDAIRIEHGYNLEDEFLAQHLCFFVVWIR